MSKTKVNLVLAIVCAVLIAGNCVFADQSFQKQIIASDSGTAYYGIATGDADTAVTGKEVYTTSYNAASGNGALTQYNKNTGSWTSAVAATSATPYYDLEIGDVTRELSGDQTYWVDQPQDIAYVRGDGYYLATSASGSWASLNVAQYTGNRPYSPSLNIGSVAVGDAHDGTGGAWQQAYYSSNETTSGAALNRTVIWDRYGNKEGYSSAYHPQGWDMTVGNAISGLSGSEQNNEIVSSYAGYVAINSNGTMYQTHDYASFGVRLVRGVTIGDVRPADDPMNPDDPWAGNEIVAAASQHVGYVSGSGTGTPDQNFWLMMAINWKDPVGDGTTIGNNGGTFADSYIEDMIIQQAVNGSAGESTYPRRIASGDIDNDGLDEIVVASYGSLPGLSIFSWDTASGDWITQVIDASKDYYDVRISDIDGNGKLDILYAANGEAGVYTIPEPATMILLGIGSIAALRRGKKA